MDINDERIQNAIKQTEVLRPPKQHLSTFGTTNVYYYLVTEPSYTEVTKETAETVVREGRVVAERPKIVTPYYLQHLEGFSGDARRYFEALISEHGANAPGLFYSYKNEPKELNIVSDNLLSVVDKLNEKIDKRGDALAAIVRGVDELWDVSILKFIYEITRSSVKDNLMQMGARGLLDLDASGVTAEVRMRLNGLFNLVERGELEPRKLKEELDRWGLFELYEDRFLAIFKRGRRI